MPRFFKLISSTKFFRIFSGNFGRTKYPIGIKGFRSSYLDVTHRFQQSIHDEQNEYLVLR